jgi:hypothetical protein
MNAKSQDIIFLQQIHSRCGFEIKLLFGKSVGIGFSILLQLMEIFHREVSKTANHYRRTP